MPVLRGALLGRSTGRRSSWLAFLVCGPLLALACKSSVKGEAKASSNGSAEVDFDASGKRDEAWESETLPSSGSKNSSSTGSSTAIAGSPTHAALLGARHDLTVSGSPSPACQCLAVLAGAPNRSGMSWSGTPPEIDPRTQLVVALTSTQVSCTSEAPKASYMGYEVRGQDVVIQIEGAVAGRPLTQGAIVPRPMSGGKLVIESAATLPYGKPLSGTGSCIVSF